ncbi:MAG: CoB--CoM heterodisulfide reductase iron-sulfur subunit A family protein, partial [Nitrosomonadales bacterium]|nr:CoB--CoM heterodisulfide reductase iron-sulfur subunit A family protein [Nitrosomonadales bacterium]
MSEMKTAAYICQGCGIAERLSTKQMAVVAQKEGKMQLVREHAFLCNAEGVQMIRDDIATEAVTHVMIAACSRRAKTEAFSFPDVTMVRANVREGVIWSQPENGDAQEITQEMADDYVRMGCAELKKMKLPQGTPNKTRNKRILVVGGGISGLTAALESAAAGYEVVLVEKRGELGGWAANLWKCVPAKSPYSGPADTGISALIAEVTGHPRISVYLNATIAQTDGAPGRFQVQIASESGAMVTEEVGAIVQASGFTGYDINKLPELGGGKSPNVVDQAGLERLVIEARGQGRAVRRPSDGGEVRSVAFIQCAGQRDESGKHLPYCSGHCCNTSIKQAMYFKDANPGTDTAVIYTDLRTPGMGEDFYRSGQDKGVTFTKGAVSDVAVNGNTCTVKFKDLILDEDSSIEADLVVLATGQVPNSGVNIDIPEEAQTEAQPVSILNLSYRQGKDLPQLKHGLTDSHFICFPYETRRTGIYAAGWVRAPSDTEACRVDAAGAALT